MFQVRNRIFETNSSSVHSITFISDAEMDAFRTGEMLFDIWNGMVTREEAERDADNREYKHIYSNDDLYELGYEYGGSAFASTEDLPDGGHVNYICYYGHD